MASAKLARLFVLMPMPRDCNLAFTKALDQNSFIPCPEAKASCRFRVFVTSTAG